MSGSVHCDHWGGGSDLFGVRLDGLLYEVHQIWGSEFS